MTEHNARKPFGAWGSATNPAGGANSAPLDPLAGGAGCPSPKPHPGPSGLGLRPFWPGLSCPHSKISSDAADLVDL